MTYGQWSCIETIIIRNKHHEYQTKLIKYTQYHKHPAEHFFSTQLFDVTPHSFTVSDASDKSRILKMLQHAK